MSPREEVQEKLVEFLESNSATFSAPYGVIPALSPVKNGPGKVRTITFGVSRWLDACIYIWAPNRINIKGQGAMQYQVEGEFDSVDAVIEHLKKMIKK